MARLGWLITFGAMLLVAGCLGLPDDGEAIDEQTTEATNASATDACQAFRANLTDLLEARDEDPFGERDWPSKPMLRVCGQEGAFMLLAEGLEGSQLLQLSWRFPQETGCKGDYGVATTDGHHRYYVSAQEGPEEAVLFGYGSGGGGLIVDAFAGPVDTRDVEPGQGATSWSSSIDEDFAAGDHRLQFAVKGWGGWDTSLTEGAAFFLGLVCEDPFSFEGTATSSELHLFSHRDMETGAGAGVSLAEASAGQALDVSLDKEARLALGSFAIAGAGVVEVDTPTSRYREPFHPQASVHILEDMEPGDLTVSLARSGVTAVVGAVYADLVPIPAEEIVRST